MTKHLAQFFTEDIKEKAFFIESHSNELDPLVSSLEYDSRNVKQGSLFFALPGLHTDGSLYINDAIKNGAVVIVHENDIAEKKDNVVYIKVENARFAMSPISASFYDFPSRHLFVTGVTGTNGKSTTVYLIWQLLRMLGKKAGFISTVQSCLGGEVEWNAEHQTTPEAPIIQRLLREMADNGCEYAVLESSSHGLSPKTNRLGDVEFCCAVFTNLTHEHLEFHGTFEQYMDDKANLFRSLNRYTQNGKSNFIEPFGIVNADDESSSYFINMTRHNTFKYSTVGENADLILESIQGNSSGNWYSVFIPEINERIEIRDKLPGIFNSSNVFASLLTVSNLLQLPVKEIALYVKKLQPVRGRMFTIIKGQPFEVVVDYAHTPASFQAIFPSLRCRFDKSGGKIISVFGCPGERDTKKRTQQGQIAALYSDIIIITDEDPRGENPIDIIEEVAGGVYAEKERTIFKQNENLFLIPDRLAAIRRAFALAGKGDLVLLLGKGHENSIIYADHVLPFDEITEAEKALSEMGY